MSESASGSGSTSQPVEENADEKDVHNYLCEKVGKLHMETSNHVDVLLNNLTVVEGDDDDDNDEAMKRFAYSMAQEIQDAEFDTPTLGHHVLLELTDRLQIEYEEMKQVITNIHKELKDNEKESAGMDQQILMLKTTVEKRDTEGEMQEGQELDKKIAAAKKILDQSKKWVAQMVEELFGDEDEAVTDALRELTRSHLHPELDTYVEVTEDVAESSVISMLNEAGLIIRHPYEPKRIRLAGFD